MIDKVLQPQSRIEAIRQRFWEALQKEWPIRVSCFIVLINGLLPIINTLFTRFPPYYSIYDYILPFGIFNYSRPLTVAIGLALVYLSFGILQRRRVAWWIAVVSLDLALAITLVFRQWHQVPAPAITLAFLLIIHGRFTVLSESQSIKRGLALSIFILLFAIVCGIWCFSLLDRYDSGINLGLGDALVTTLRRFFLVGNTDLVSDSQYGRYFMNSLSIMGGLTFGILAYSIFRPVRYRFRVTPQEISEAKSILVSYGNSSYDYFKVWPDKAYFLSSSRRSFISYKVVRNVAFCLGDPVGPKDDVEDSAREFLRFCSDNGWLVMFLVPQLLPMYKRLGLSTLKVGREAIVDLDHFSSNTVKNHYFVKIRRRFEQRGYKLFGYQCPHPPALLDEMEEVSNIWISSPGRHEVNFIEGAFERNYLATTPVYVLRDSTGRPIAFINEITSNRPGEANYDLARHLPEMPYGAMDYTFTELMLALKQQGYRSFDFGMAPMAGIGESSGAPIAERAVKQLFERVRLFASYKGLRDYKIKFEPNWEDRFVAYQGGPLGLVRIALSMGKALE
jgi:phosphatidylglycerol lysyltransferase